MSESFAIPLSSFMKTENHLRKKKVGKFTLKGHDEFWLNKSSPKFRKKWKGLSEQKNKPNLHYDPTPMHFTQQEYV